MALLLAAFAAPLSRALFDGRTETGVIVLIGLALPAFAAAQFTREVLRLEFRAWSYLATSLAGAAVAAAISILAVVAWDAGVNGPFIGALAGPLVGAVYGLALVWRRLTARPSRHELSVMLRFGIPLIPTALALWALSLIDRVMLARLADLDEVGQYAVANRVAMPVLLIVTALGVAFSPFILSIYQTDPEREKQVAGAGADRLHGRARPDRARLARCGRARSASSSRRISTRRTARSGSSRSGWSRSGSRASPWRASRSRARPAG